MKSNIKVKEHYPLCEYDCHLYVLWFLSKSVTQVFCWNRMLWRRWSSHWVIFTKLKLNGLQEMLDLLILQLRKKSAIIFYYKIELYIFVFLWRAWACVLLVSESFHNSLRRYWQHCTHTLQYITRPSQKLPINFIKHSIKAVSWPCSHPTNLVSLHNEWYIVFYSTSLANLVTS